MSFGFGVFVLCCIWACLSVGILLVQIGSMAYHAGWNKGFHEACDICRGSDATP